MALKEVTNRIKEMEEKTRTCQSTKDKVLLMTIAFVL